jgi:CRISPR-associated protein Csn2
MKLVHPQIENHFNLTENLTHELVIENPDQFRAMVSDLVLQQDANNEGDFVLSNDTKILPISSNARVIIDPLHIDLSDRKLLTKIYSAMAKNSSSEQFYEKTDNIRSMISDYIDEILKDVDISDSLIMNYDFKIDQLFKATDLVVEIESNDISETLLEYANLMRELLSVDLIITVNLRSYLSDEKLQLLLETMQNEKLNLIMIESFARDNNGLKIKRTVIDKDLCEI